MKRPSSVVKSLRDAPVPSLIIVTAAPTMIPPEESVTTPEIDPVTDSAETVDTQNESTKNERTSSKHRETNLIMSGPPYFGGVISSRSYPCMSIIRTVNKL